VLPLDDNAGVEQYVPDGITLCDATAHEIRRQVDASVSDVHLKTGAAIFGTLLDPQGEALAGALVVAQSAAAETLALARDGITDEAGYYEIVGIADQTDGMLWTVEIQQTDALPEQFLGQAWDELGAEVFDVSSGAADAGTRTARPGGGLSGVATGPAGEAIEGTVFVYTSSGSSSGSIEGGSWLLEGLPPGDVTLWIEADGYATTWWPSDAGPTTAVVVFDGVVTGGIEVRAAREARVTGQLLGADDFTGSSVVLIDDAHSISVATTVEADGQFSLTGLNPGQWRVTLLPEDGLGLVEGDLRDAEGQPLVLDLEIGETDVGPLQVAPGATVLGKAFDRETGGGIYGAWIYVENIDSGITRLARAERDGTYSAEALSPGTYRVWAEYTPYCPGDPNWAARYYPDQVNPSLVASIPLAPGQIHVWDPPLAVDADHDRMGDSWEAAYGLNTGLDDGEEDLDGDGFSNLEEYLLGTNPSTKPGAGCGCASASRAPVAVWLSGLLLVVVICQRRSTGRQLPV
jgi:hypothetical protein